MDYIEKHFKLDIKSKANPESVVLGHMIRFTVITDRLIRMEFNRNNRFEDRPSKVFWHREQDVPRLKVVKDEEHIEIITDYIHLNYIINEEGFSPDTLKIELLENGSLWRFGDRDRENLFGTIRTLDEVNGEVPLEKGLLSKSGWSVIDESDSVVFNEDGWVDRRTGGKDIYFFGYGREYIKCIQDFTKVSGNVPLIPRWILGNWWSRYWRYDDRELKELMLDFKNRGIPLSVCIVDMDWHIVENKYSSGWTGYTWNRDLFPDPERFMEFIHEMGLKTALNLHPASGIHAHEERYPEMAEFMDIDPRSEKPVEFDITDPRFVKGYFNILHHPLESQGVDFWWMDWQQGTNTKMANLDPLFLLNHLHFYDLGRDGTKRPFVFSRFSGMGSQRYPIGFSGDTIVSWESLKFQPYFTLTSSNAAYGWWSHDIGGHMFGTEDSELYARWVQLGVLSPILRIHSTNNPYQDRRPWKQGLEAYETIKNALNLRHAFIPYLYSMAWETSENRVPLVRPMYYYHPEKERAYGCKNQYYFGTQLIAAPFTSPRDKGTNLSRQLVWLPEGEWFDFFDGEYYLGNKEIAVYGDLNQIPLFARGGAIVPLDGKPEFGRTESPEILDVYVFPGGDNEFELYEDDGKTTAYKAGKYFITKFAQKWHNNKMSIEVCGEGDAGCAFSERTYNIIIRGILRPEDMKIIVNNENRNIEYSYDMSKDTVIIKDIRILPKDKVNISLLSESGLLSKRNRVREKLERLLRAFTMESQIKKIIHDKLIDGDLGFEGLTNETRMDYKDHITQSQLTALIETKTGRELLSSINI